MPSTTSSLTRFSVRSADAVTAAPNTTSTADPVPSAPSAKRRGTGRRVGIAVRLGHEDWYRLHDLAVREHSSLQGLIVAGLSELMRQKGLPPLSGQ